MKPFFRDLTVEREFESGTRVESYRIGPAGVTIPAVRQKPNPGAATVDPIVHWDGRSMVIESTAAGGAPATGWREVWAHNPDGGLTLTLTRRSPTDTATTEAYIYRRQ